MTAKNASSPAFQLSFMILNASDQNWNEVKLIRRYVPIAHNGMNKSGKYLTSIIVRNNFVVSIYIFLVCEYKVKPLRKIKSTMDLYNKWCDATRDKDNRRHYWTYVEKDGGREKIFDDLAETIRSHYDRLERIAQDVDRLGYKVAAEILCEAMPHTPKGRSGDLGEILATELVEEEIGLRVPVRRLRYKDGRNMAMRGDDFIGAGYDGKGEKLWLLKGEAKSNKVLGKATVTSARKVLNRDSGRCTPDSLLFVANRLLESDDSDDNALGRSLRDEVGLKSLRADRIDHMLFTVSGNGPHASLKEDLEATSANRDHYVVNIHVEDHQDFIAAMYEEAEDLGDD